MEALLDWIETKEFWMLNCQVLGVMLVMAIIIDFLQVIKIRKLERQNEALKELIRVRECNKKPQ